MSKVFKINKYPENTLIRNDMGVVDYFDSYMTVKKTTDPILEITRKLLQAPGWVNTLMYIREILIARPFGLRTGNTAKNNAQTSQKQEFELAPILFSNENELVMGEDDKHLYFRLSVLKINKGVDTEIYLTTVVRFNNTGGKVYFALIRLFHGLVVRTMLKKL
jgi:hypothetical protein